MALEDRMLWVDPTDPEVFAAVIGEDPEMLADEDAAEIARACAVASEILTMATAHLVHPAGEQTEEFVTRRADRFSPVYGPVTRWSGGPGRGRRHRAAVPLPEGRQHRLRAPQT
jgi:hypothetical protein